MTEFNTLACSFCGKQAGNTKQLVTNRTLSICNECIDVSYLGIRTSLKLDKEESSDDASTPSRIKEKLDQHVIGQERAKKILSVAAYNHYKRLDMLEDKSINTEMNKSNVILIGGTGCGKTLLVSKLAKILEVPFASTEATSLTEAGYVGSDVESVLTRLLSSSNRDAKLASTGIVYIDEIDKIAGGRGGSSSGSDVARESVQQALLKMLEGAVVDVPLTSDKMSAKVEVDTTNILFIVAGAFEGILELVAKEDSPASIGFGSELKTKKRKEKDLYQKVEPHHIVEYGMIPELVGRIPIIAALDTLEEEDLIKILTDPKDAIVSQFKHLFKLEDVKLSFTDAALAVIAKKAIKRNTGARGLRSIVESLLLECMYMLPDNDDIKEIIVNRNTVNNNEQPKLIMR